MPSRIFVFVVLVVGCCCYLCCCSFFASPVSLSIVLFITFAACVYFFSTFSSFPSLLSSIFSLPSFSSVSCSLVMLFHVFCFLSCIFAFFIMLLVANIVRKYCCSFVSSFPISLSHPNAVLSVLFVSTAAPSFPPSLFLSHFLTSCC